MLSEAAASYRHSILDLVQLLPHSNESKLNVKRNFKLVVDIAEIKLCASAVLFECHKFKDLCVDVRNSKWAPVKLAAQNSKCFFFIFFVEICISQFARCQS